MDILATHHVLINNTRIAYGVYGQGEPIVLLHGTPSSSLIWRNIVPSLVSAGYKVHLFDLLGFGLSERPWDPSVDTSISGQVPILEGLLQHWELETTHVAAHDIGGAVAQRFAVFNPQRVRSLTLVDVVSFDSYPSKRTREMQGGLANITRAPVEEHERRFRDWLLSAVHNQDQFASSSLDTYLGYICGPVGQASIFQHQIEHYDPKHTMEIADKMQVLGQLPVKLIWGAEDSWQVTDWAHKLHAAIPGSDLSIVEDCGHFSLEDQPVKIAELLTKFLAQARQTGDR
ncbi:alpha/beta hydrolase [Emericellopsis atlantica]|uniref:Alpha/beta hydrolase n=1 Tax=Emericellopsis atlantica TaxID=2614577 RepID=A0A9P8CPN6_9HYPO|nr:alpha/beta hydrolase [Emericellopsis atlantica]KAG9252931.1 alpha/beta hydrolase [Emericellopsis atlantica]